MEVVPERDADVEHGGGVGEMAAITPTPEPVEGVTLTEGELEQLADSFADIAGIFRGAVLRG